MKILVTGGAGFIGTHLCRRLVRSGHEVRSLDLKSPKSAVAGVRYHLGDVMDSELLSRLMEGVDAVYHFAALVSVPLCQNDPELSYLANLLLTVRVLKSMQCEAELRGKMPKLVFAGSSVVYGATAGPGEACDEGTISETPLSFYGAQKLACEHAIRLFVEKHAVPTVVFRFFNVYGAGQDRSSPYSGVITIFSSAIEEGLPLRLHGGGVQTRDFISVHDVVHACESVLDLPDSECDGFPINLGSGYSVTIRELAETMIRVSGRDVELQDSAPRFGDVPHSLADIGRAKRILGWAPRYSLEKGLAEIVPAPYQQQLAAVS